MKVKDLKKMYESMMSWFEELDESFQEDVRTEFILTMIYFTGLDKKVTPKEEKFIEELTGLEITNIKEVSKKLEGFNIMDSIPRTVQFLLEIDKDEGVDFMTSITREYLLNMSTIGEALVKVDGAKKIESDSLVKYFTSLVDYCEAELEETAKATPPKNEINELEEEEDEEEEDEEDDENEDDAFIEISIEEIGDQSEALFPPGTKSTNTKEKKTTKDQDKTDTASTDLWDELRDNEGCFEGAWNYLFDPDQDYSKKTIKSREFLFKGFFFSLTMLKDGLKVILHINTDNPEDNRLMAKSLKKYITASLKNEGNENYRSFSVESAEEASGMKLTYKLDNGEYMFSNEFLESLLTSFEKIPEDLLKRQAWALFKLEPGPKNMVLVQMWDKTIDGRNKHVLRYEMAFRWGYIIVRSAPDTYGLIGESYDSFSRFDGDVIVDEELTDGYSEFCKIINKERDKDVIEAIDSYGYDVEQLENLGLRMSDCYVELSGELDVTFMGFEEKEKISNAPQAPEMKSGEVSVPVSGPTSKLDFWQAFKPYIDKMRHTEFSQVKIQDDNCLDDKPTVITRVFNSILMRAQKNCSDWSFISIPKPKKAICRFWIT
jgi:hypothetical protein